MQITGLRQHVAPAQTISGLAHSPEGTEHASGTAPRTEVRGYFHGVPPGLSANEPHKPRKGTAGHLERQSRNQVPDYEQDYDYDYEKSSQPAKIFHGCGTKHTKTKARIHFTMDTSASPPRTAASYPAFCWRCLVLSLFDQHHPFQKDSCYNSPTWRFKVACRPM